VPIFQPYSAFPASDRDIAFIVSAQFSVADIARSMRQAGGKLLESLELFDDYRGTIPVPGTERKRDLVAEKKRSLAFRLVYRADDRTLTDEDVEPVHQKVRAVLEEKFQAELRS
jgi:phenylalanyl-tRNA synthetase beta chain